MTYPHVNPGKEGQRPIVAPFPVPLELPGGIAEGIPQKSHRYLRSQKLKIILYLTVFYSDKILVLCELSLD